MGEIVEISRYRALKRNEFLSRYGQKLEQLIKAHLQQNFPIDIRRLQSMYCDYRALDDQTHWEISDLRDVIHDVVVRLVLEPLTTELSNLYWYDASVWTTEELTEKCVSMLILEDVATANTSN